MYALARARSSRTMYALPSGRFLLGAITSDQAAESIFPRARITKNAGHNQDVYDAIRNAAEAGYLNLQLPALCRDGARPPGMVAPALLNTASGMAMKFVGPAFGAGPIVGGIVLAGALLSKVFSAILAHHAQAVKKEQSILCAAVPAANDALSVIDQVLAAGQSTPSQAMDALDQVVSGFSQATDSIRHGADPMASGECNAACVWLSALRGLVARKKSQYQDLAAQQAQQAATVPGQIVSAVTAIPGQIAAAISSGNFSSLLPWAAAGVGLYLVLKEG